MSSVDRRCHDLRIVDKHTTWRLLFRIETCDGASLSAPARSGYTTGTLCASETGVSATSSAPR